MSILQNLLAYKHLVTFVQNHQIIRLYLHSLDTYETSLFAPPSKCTSGFFDTHCSKESLGRIPIIRMNTDVNVIIAILEFCDRRSGLK